MEPEVLRAQGPHVREHRAEFGTAARRLKDDLESLGKPWQGAGFDGIYIPIRDGMFTSMDSLGERLESIGDKLQGMARTNTASDEQGVHVVSSVSRLAA
ncbi:WXG100 family type VII secretion target [Streptomyces sp. NPDC018045]|uniref:WXG100 family type VII secretion target n=1 Tax=Streptomyces sp. NPDC018045 TaxID=3365037 RepID=UPI0037872970